MDLLTLISDKDLIEYASNVNYERDFLGAKLFGTQKVENPLVTMRRLVQGSNTPVMAQVHALDTEARIGERPNFEEIQLKSLLIKEKLNTTERIEEVRALAKSEILDTIYDDAQTLINRNLTRAEVMRMELLGTGKVTVDENGVKKELNYGMPSTNNIGLSGWATPSHDIIADLNLVKKTAQAYGYKIVRAITTEKVIGYMMANTAIKGFWNNNTAPLTEAGLLTWLNDNFGIEFITNDEMYKTSVSSTALYRFFPEDTITWLTTTSVIGTGLYGVTPEQRSLLKLDNVQEKMLVTLTLWNTPDPVATWTKGSSVFLPVIHDINGLFISKIS